MPSVGTVYVDVRPSTRGFVNDMREDLLRDADKMGEDLGRRVGENAGGHIGRQLADDIEKAMDDAGGNAGKKAGEKAAKDWGGAFNRVAKAQISKAMSDLGKFKVDVELDDGELAAEIAYVNGELKALRDLRIKAEIDTDDFVAELAQIKAGLEALHDERVEADVRFNIKQALADLETIEAAAARGGEEIGDALEKGIERGLGGFASKVRNEIRKAQETIPDIEIDADTSPAVADIMTLRALLGDLHANIDVDTDIAGVIAELAILDQLISQIDNNDIDINIRDDINAVRTRLRALIDDANDVNRGFRDFGSAGDQAGERIFQRLSRVRLIIALIISLLPLIAGAFSALPAVLGAIALPIAAVMAGLDGIKSSFSGLQDQFGALRDASAAAFEKGLAPAIRDISGLMPVLTEGLAGTSTAVAKMATDLTSMLRAKDGLGDLVTMFERTNSVLSISGPVLSLFTQNLLTLINVGMSQMGGFVQQLIQVGEAFADMLAYTSEMGVLQSAIAATFQVLASLVGLIGPLMEFGNVLMQAFGPALAVVIDGIGIGLTVFARALDSLPGPVTTVLAVITTLGIAIALFGVNMQAAQARLSAFASTMATGLGVAAINAAAGVAGIQAAFRGLMTFLANNWLTIAIIGIVTALSFLGQANQEAAAAEAAHRQAVEELGQALQRTGGIIDANIVGMTRTKLEADGGAEAMDKLGFSHNQTAAIIAAGGPAYDGLVRNLEFVAKVSTAGVYAGGQLGESFREQQQAAQALLPKIQELRQQFVEAQAAQEAYKQALIITGQSMVGGLANANALQQAVGTLGNEMSSTTEKTNALKAALDALNNGQITADNAAAKLVESIQGIGKTFEAAEAATKKAGVSLIMANGAIDNTTEAGRKLTTEASQMRDAMVTSAAAAFDAAGGLNNVQAASAAAEAEVQKSHDAFVKAAMAAGLTATQAEVLAVRYGMIPKVVSTLLQAQNLPTVMVELSQLSAQIQQVPTGTTVRVDVMSKEAIALLRAIGIEVTELPGGKVEVTADDKTKEMLPAILAYIASQNGKLPVGADGQPLTAAIPGLKAIVEGSGANLPISGQPKVEPGIASATATVNSSRAELPIEGRNEVFTAVTAATATVNSSRAELPIVGRNDVSGSPGLTSATATVNSAKADMPITGLSNVAPGVAQAQSQVAGAQAPIPITGQPNVQPGIDAAKAQVAGSTAAMPITGTNNVGPGLDAAKSQVTGTVAAISITGTNNVQAGLDAAKSAVTNTTATMKIDADPALANQKLADFVRKVTDTTATLKIDADVSAAQQKYDALAAPRTSTLTVTVNQVQGTVVGPNALGNILPTNFMGFAAGGMAKKMRANHASIVPPRTYRMIGDRARDDEAYIPINQSARSKSLLAITASRMGYGLAPLAMAAGGLVNTTTSMAELLRRQRLLGSSSFASLNRPTATSAMGLMGADPKEVQTRLDSMISLLQKTADRPPAQITVEDKSGDPVATGRATVLAMRLAR